MTYQVSNLAANTVGAHDQLETRSSRAIGHFEYDLTISVSGRVGYLLVPLDLLRRNGGQQGGFDLRAIKLRSIAAFAPGFQLVHLVIPHPRLGGVSQSTVLAHQVEATGLFAGSLTTAHVKVETSTTWDFISMASLIQDIVGDASLL